MLRGIISLGLCLFIIPMSSLLAQGLQPFSLGDTLRSVEQIKAMRMENQRREIELRQQEQRRRELELRRQEQQNQQSPAPTYAPQSNYEDEILSRFVNAIKFRRHRYEDFDNVIHDENLRITLDMVALMAESPYAADIAYYLGKHPDESAAISRMALPQAGKAIFSIENKLIQSDFKIE